VKALLAPLGLLELFETIRAALLDVSSRGVSVRLSFFNTAEAADEFLYMMLDGVTGRLKRWAWNGGIALMAADGTMLYYRRANLVIVCRLRFGQANLQPVLEFVTAAVKPL